MIAPNLEWMCARGAALSPWALRFTPRATLAESGIPPRQTRGSVGARREASLSRIHRPACVRKRVTATYTDPIYWTGYVEEIRAALGLDITRNSLACRIEAWRAGQVLAFPETVEAGGAGKNHNHGWQLRKSGNTGVAQGRACSAPRDALCM
ncbi:hypothetical protein GQ53DRAFT_740770, partial [Thozetella sp. PMI_491]